MKKYKTIIIFIALLIVVGGAAIAYPKLSKKYGTPTTNNSSLSSNPDSQKEKAIDFTVYDTEGNEAKLSDFFGKPIVLNFWASWCPPCKAEMPTFEGIYKDMKDEVQFLMVDMVDGQRETVAKGKAFIEENEYTFPVFFDTDGEAAYTYQIASIPTTVFIDSEGNIVKTHKSMMNAIQLQGAIAEITDK